MADCTSQLAAGTIGDRSLDYYILRGDMITLSAAKHYIHWYEVIHNLWFYSPTFN